MLPIHVLGYLYTVQFMISWFSEKHKISKTLVRALFQIISFADTLSYMLLFGFTTEVRTPLLVKMLRVSSDYIYTN